MSNKDVWSMSGPIPSKSASAPARCCTGRAKGSIASAWTYSGALEPVGITTRRRQPVLPGVRCDAALSLCGQRTEVVPGPADRDRQCLRGGCGKRRAHIPEPAANAWHRSVPCRRGPAAAARVRRQFMSGSVCVLKLRRTAASMPPATSSSIWGRASIRRVRPGRMPIRSRSTRPAGMLRSRPRLGQALVYRFDATRGMMEPGGAPLDQDKPGAGPRHVALHPGGRFGYLVNELNSTMAALA